MKNPNCFLLIILLLVCVTAVQAISLKQALKEKKILLYVKWKTQENEENNSLRHGNNLLISLKNLGNSPLDVEIPAGFLFTAAEDSRQNMLLTMEVDFALMPQQLLVKSAHGYCCEANDKSPLDEDNYLVKQDAGKELNELARYVAAQKLSGYAVQRAIWCVSDKKDLDLIQDEDTSVSRRLIGFTGKLMNTSELEITKALRKAIRGSKACEKAIKVNLPILAEGEQIWIVIQNINNINLQTVMTKQVVARGYFEKQFGVSSLDLGKGNFVVRIYSTHKPVQSIPFTLDV